MRLGDYLRGRRFVMQTPLAREEVARRIGEATAPASGVFGRGIFGWARFGRLRLRVRDGWWMYRAKPVLAGRIEAIGRGSRLRLNHRAPLWIPAFLIVWYPILIASAVGMISEGKLGAAAASDVAIAASVLAVMLVAPLVTFHLASARSESDLLALTAFLEREVEARAAA